LRRDEQDWLSLVFYILNRQLLFFALPRPGRAGFRPVLPRLKQIPVFSYQF